MNYSPIANPEVKLCLPSATVTRIFFQAPDRKVRGAAKRKEKEDNQFLSRYCVFVTQESVIANNATYITGDAAVLVIN